MYRKLESDRIVETLERLERRIGERFADAGLRQVCLELTGIARQTQARSAEIARPDRRLRALVTAILVVGLILLLSVMWNLLSAAKASNDLFDTLQGIDSGFNIVVLMGASLFFMVTLEERLKRRRALAALHELRSIIHVIDMHQLTKDPASDISSSEAKVTGAEAALTPAEMMRYLDYCTEMLSLASKVAVLYSQSFPDPVVTEVVNDLERTATSLSQKIWQKINILYRHNEVPQPMPAVRPAVLAPKDALA
jgi:hypothetical protein